MVMETKKRTIAVCVAAWRSPELSFDYQGVVVGVLSLLVTVLIGWQIYFAQYFRNDGVYVFGFVHRSLIW